MEEHNQNLETTSNEKSPSADNANGVKKIFKKIKALPKKVWIISAITLAVAIVATVLVIILCNIECSHSYTETISSPPSCTYSGDMKYTCSKCGYYYIDFNSIPSKGGHEWQAATCTSNPICKICKWENWEVGYAPHDYSETDGTCTSCGKGVKFVLPQTPISISNTSGYDQSCKIEKITVTRASSTKYTVTFLVQSTYHEKGNSYSDTARFGWKLYDENGIVVTSGTGYTDASIKVGEKSKESITLWIGSDSDDIQEGKTYRLELLNLG